MNFKFEEIELDKITKEQAIAIANCDRNLKDAIFIEGKKEKKIYTYIKLIKFKIALVKYKNSTDYWYIKVTEGEWGAQNKRGTELYDGEFDEESNISCLVSCDTGDFFYKNEFSESDLSEFINN